MTNASSTTNPSSSPTTAANAPFSKKVRRMLGISLHGWENAMISFLIIAGFFALIAGVATWVVVKLTREELAASKTEFEAYKVEAGKQIATANAVGETAKASAANANVRALEATLALEIFKSPRDFPPEQQAALTERVRKYSSIKFDSGVAAADPEYLFLRKQIVAALNAAGWSEVSWQGPGQTIGDIGPPGRPVVGLAGVAGVAIFLNPGSAPELWPAVTELTAALNAAGLVAHNGWLAVSGNTNANTVHVMVGRKM